MKERQGKKHTPIWEMLNDNLSKAGVTVNELLSACAWHGKHSVQDGKGLCIPVATRLSTSDRGNSGKKKSIGE